MVAFILWKLLISFTFDPDKEIREEMFKFLGYLEKKNGGGRRRRPNSSSSPANLSSPRKILSSVGNEEGEGEECGKGVKEGDSNNSTGEEKEKEEDIDDVSFAARRGVKPRDLLKRISGEVFFQSVKTTTTTSSSGGEMVALAIAALISEIDQGQEDGRRQQVRKKERTTKKPKYTSIYSIL